MSKPEPLRLVLDDRMPIIDTASVAIIGGLARACVRRSDDGAWFATLAAPGHRPVWVRPITAGSA